MSFAPPNKLHPENAAGSNGLTSYTCDYTLVETASGEPLNGDHTAVVMSVNGAGELVFITPALEIGLGIHSTALDGFNATGQVCASGPYVSEASGATYKGKLTGSSTTSTGVYELPPMVMACAGVGLLIILLIVGWSVAQRVVDNIGVADEPEDEDNLVWYRGPDGKEYWRHKYQPRRF